MRWISIDPGEDTGWAIWEDGDLVDAGTDKLWDVIDALSASLLSVRTTGDLPDFGSVGRLVVEDWALYPWKLKSLGWDKCRTARGIGAFEVLCRISGTQLSLQPASIKKSAVSAGAEELFLSPLHENRHCNDAIMHGVFFLASQ
ncbi:hypothetical protein UFOVP1328_27 [uncultured Caudovirales phage]|uniref:RuvC-like resolvase n=1 Tax=uncultured Caudovirales phage TaxID=2100421 RepID=A0A6J5QF65_9CAUD|nr:hypothetical protein UFOVP1084_51 [uncultured Caudovirales phage]CAB4199237.1 hypothetical protein UFOVP1328_27 [uncultured Caudovirales phage]CAB5228443.1 hypothetical protein UFOVP1532_58 [uncultured Caudovirales phage]